MFFRMSYELPLYFFYTVPGSTINYEYQSRSYRGFRYSYVRTVHYRCVLFIRTAVNCCDNWRVLFLCTTPFSVPLCTCVRLYLLLALSSAPPFGPPPPPSRLASPSL